MRYLMCTLFTSHLLVTWVKKWEKMITKYNMRHCFTFLFFSLTILHICT